MSAPAADCPALDELDRLASGQADGETRAQLEQHLSSCDSCSRQLAEVLSNLELAGALRASWPALPAAAVPEQVGPYRVLREIGRGGMGVVFEAEQASPRRKVAIKLLHAGQREDALSERMLHREARALARLKHPGIATILDAGRNADGRAYVAMELVEGTSLTRHAEQHRLDLEQRLALFLELCQAIAYAHQQGVIHRDIKPSNVLVEESGRVRVLDFGLAKVFDIEGDESSLSASIDTGRVQGTLPYMSPEQVRGEGDRVEVRSDVYALGVVLYELVVGQLPLDLRGARLPAATRIICEVEPVRPRSVRPELPADLETILLTALAKDQELRYASASALALDIERMRAGLPILARTPSSVYVLLKLAGRHKIAFALSSALLLSLLAGSILSSLMYLRSEDARKLAVREGQTTLAALAAEASAREEADQARVQADAEAERARQQAATATRVREFLVGVFEAATPNVAQGESVSARHLLEQGALDIDRDLEGEPLARCAIHHAIGRCYVALGDYEGASAHLDAAVVIGRSLQSSEPGEFAGAAGNRAGLSIRQGDLAGARALLEEALSIVERAGLRRQRAALLSQLASVYAEENDQTRATELQREAISVHAALPDADLIELSRYELNLAMGLFELGHVAEALERSERALESLRSLGTHTDVLEAENNHAYMLYSSGDAGGAERGFRRVLALREGLGLAEHPDTATQWNNLAVLLENQDRYTEAEDAHRRAIAILAAAVGDETPTIALMFANLARNLYLQKRYEEAEERARHALAVQERLLPLEHPQRANTHTVLGLIAEKRGAFEDAVVEFAEALSINERSRPPGHGETEKSRALLGEALVHAGRPDEAEPILLAAAESLDVRSVRSRPMALRCYQALAHLYRARGDTQSAELWAARRQVALDAGRDPVPTAEEPARDSAPVRRAR